LKKLLAYNHFYDRFIPETATKYTGKEKKMNETQRKYLISRIEELARQKEKAITEKFTVPAKRLAFEEKLKMILDKKVKLIPVAEIKYHTRFVDAYDFSKYCNDRYVDSKAADLIKQLNQEKKKMLDVAVFGKEADALGAIPKFEKAIDKIFK